MEYIKAIGIYYPRELSTIKKKKGFVLQPIYEAFTNAWEAIVEKYSIDYLNHGNISINVYLHRNLKLDEIIDFDKITIEDNGIGINDNAYRRLINLRDDTKSFSNKGTGRVQYIHFFDDTTIESVYKSDESTYKKRIITLSKKEAFLRQNAIMRLDENSVADSEDTFTITTFRNPLDEKERDIYRVITCQELKKAFIEHFLSKFCDNRERLPHISIHLYINNEVTDSQNIVGNDIPQPDKEDTVIVHYSKLNERQKIVQIPDREESFQLRSFVHSEDILPENVIYLVSNGAIGTEIHLDNITKNDNVDGKRYMFLLSGSYIDNNDSDDRGNIKLVTAAKFKKQNAGSIFPEEVVLLDDIKSETNKKIGEIYQEIADKNNEKFRNIDELQQMFLLNPETVEMLKTKIKNSDTDEQILQKIYESDAKIKAQQDAEIKQQVDNISALVPTDANYQEQLKERIAEFVRTIPLQNRTALSQYVARRKLVLEIFEKILDGELERLREGKRINEDILHNLIFQQHTDSPEDSDLWLINEEYIYFTGTSDLSLNNITIDGLSLLKADEELSEEELAYKTKCNKDAGNRKPDILLFPNEGKCIIIEFKAPDVDVANHLHQINRYARLINNLSREQFNFQIYYGYLIGQNIDIDEIQDSDPNFKSASNLNYIFRPHLPITGKFGRKDGALYTEIIKYSDILERAKLRNQIFIDKLEKGNNP